MTSPWHWLATSACIAAMCGCTGYRDPLITVLEFQPGTTSDEASVVNFTLELVNPNSEPLRLLNFDYQVTANGQSVYEGKRSAEATLAANSTRRIEIPAVIPSAAAAQAQNSGEYAIEGSLQYITPGEWAQILLDIGVRKPRAHFSQRQMTLASGE